MELPFKRPAVQRPETLRSLSAGQAHPPQLGLRQWTHFGCCNSSVAKTTLLSGLLALVPPTERLLIVEGSRELAPDHPHVIGLEARAPNAELVGAITMTDLVRQSLRMRPDRVVIGEVRGPEI